jgi:hypothetical protein
MSLFNSDLAKETILGGFLDKHYQLAGLKMQRMTDKNLQMKGVDLVLETDNGINYKVDEKAQLHYLNTDLPTFALEINYYKHKVLKQGLLFDSNKITEIYAFVFGIYLQHGSTSLTSEENIKACDVVFAKRLTLITELAKLGLDIKTCEAHGETLRNGSQGTKIAHASGFNFQVSHHLQEAPVNLVVRRVFLEKIGKVFKFRV